MEDNTKFLCLQEANAEQRKRTLKAVFSGGMGVLGLGDEMMKLWYISSLLPGQK